MSTQEAKLNLVEPTSTALNHIADEVEPKEIPSSRIQTVIDRMLELATEKDHAPSDTRQMVGLAAPQLGVSKRLIIIDTTANGEHKKQNLQVFINPKIVSQSKATLPGREGCWSCDNICGNVERSAKVTLAGYNREAVPVEVEFTNFTARIAQHEVDHLDGIRFPGRIPLAEPAKLHWVEPGQFEEYRTHWQHWPIKYPRERWEALKSRVL